MALLHYNSRDSYYVVRCVKSDRYTALSDALHTLLTWVFPSELIGDCVHEYGTVERDRDIDARVLV